MSGRNITYKQVTYYEAKNKILLLPITVKIQASYISQIENYLLSLSQRKEKKNPNVPQRKETARQIGTVPIRGVIEFSMSQISMNPLLSSIDMSIKWCS